MIARQVAGLAAGLLGMVLVASACTPSAPPTGHLTLFVAASLSGAIDAATVDFTTTHPGTTFTQSTGSSTALRIQIEQGATADVLLSADTQNPQALATAGLTDGEPVTFASNSLAIVVPKGNPGALQSPSDLARSGLRIVAAGEAVPITGYASTLLSKLATAPGGVPDLPARYAANVVSREEDVKAVLAKVELGEADAAIVYATDAQASTRVDSVPIPASAQVKTAYSGAVVKRAGDMALAHDFLAWLDGPNGGVVLAEYGFSPP